MGIRMISIYKVPFIYPLESRNDCMSKKMFFAAVGCRFEEPPANMHSSEIS